VANVQDSVEVPEPPLTVAGVTVQAPLSLARVTMPVKPLTGEIVIVDVPAEFTVTVTLVGFTDMVKSGTPPTLKSTLAE